MGYERRGGRQYYYRKTRVNGRVVSTYCGNKMDGLIAETYAAFTELNKLERQELAALRARENAIDARLDSVCQQLRQVIKEGLQAAGFHQHKGSWRKKRMNTELTPELKALDLYAKRMNGYVEAVLAVDDWQSANNGARPPAELRARLETAQQACPKSWRAFGNLAESELERLIEMAWGAHYSKAQAVKTACENMRLENGYAQASPLEKLAIDEVVLAWVRLHEVQEQNTFANHAKPLNQVNCDFWDKRLLNAQQRYLRACANLARIRKLMKGVNFVQVNISTAGSQQANLMNA